MELETENRDEELLEEIARYFDFIASNLETFSAHRLAVKKDRKTAPIRATALRDAAAYVRSIQLV